MWLQFVLEFLEFRIHFEDNSTLALNNATSSGSVWHHVFTYLLLWTAHEGKRAAPALLMPDWFFQVNGLWEALISVGPPSCLCLVVCTKQSSLPRAFLWAFRLPLDNVLHSRQRMQRPMFCIHGKESWLWIFRVPMIDPLSMSCISLQKSSQAESL